MDEEREVIKASPAEARERNEVKGIFQLRYLVYYLLGALEILLAFRLIFKLLGANPESGFVSFIYGITDAFMAPFLGIFRPAAQTGIETTSVFEPSTLIAMIAYGLLGWGIAKLFDALLVGKD